MFAMWDTIQFTLFVAATLKQIGKIDFNTPGNQDTRAIYEIFLIRSNKTFTVSYVLDIWIYVDLGLTGNGTLTMANVSKIGITISSACIKSYPYQYVCSGYTLSSVDIS